VTTLPAGGAGQGQTHLGKPIQSHLGKPAGGDKHVGQTEERISRAAAPALEDLWGKPPDETNC